MTATMRDSAVLVAEVREAERTYQRAVEARATAITKAEQAYHALMVLQTKIDALLNGTKS
jgi:hypothetical protein